ncbi:alpha,alpha-trehalose-phosphate synthase (UDP-forming) [Bosea psychrotolerans]|uniref:Trehalose-6-phosphate synthase n=1 Tax=Bosea psychrotolerans TaxID=1871628 RepID=A0A2S4MF97_9HYPH|nr:alpha,alpha-trehalose-phosphate synthase (UDP-forming) [Bosea psychrotolerans]POR53412.1 trehalose 6-phosphate synthase [Bosea psychrotolerans]
MRLVIVSNRVTIPDRHEKVAAGGLAVALREALEKRGGLWFGWSGDVSDAPGGQAVRTVQRGKVTYAVTDLSESERQTYYLGFSNRALWPNMHYRLGLTEFSRTDYAGYLAVNRRFAKALIPLLKPDDLIWIHDYHLIPLAAELRRRGVTNRIGYFHHIPWPPAEVFGALPFSATLISTMGAYDLVGVQTQVDVRNLISGLVSLCGARVEGGKVRMGRRETTVQAFPIGIDVEAFRKLAAASERAATRPIKATRESLGARKLVIGVDRLDYSKGIVQRLEAFGQFLRSHPEHRGRVGLLQIAPPSRSDVPEYAELDRQSDETAGRLNAALGEFDWTPIRVVKKAYSRNALAGFYRRAQVGLVTPMRDGMNLVAKEYIAAQDPADPGVLVLSRFAGAAQQMGEALIVNPYDTHEVAEAIRTALAMPKSERIRRFERLYEIIEATDIGWWTQCYLDALSGIEAPIQDNAPKSGPKRSASKKAAPRLQVVRPAPQPEMEGPGQGETVRKTALEAAPPAAKPKGGASVKPAVAATPASNGAGLGPA